MTPYQQLMDLVKRVERLEQHNEEIAHDVDHPCYKCPHIKPSYNGPAATLGTDCSRRAMCLTWKVWIVRDERKMLPTWTYYQNEFFCPICGQRAYFGDDRVGTANKLQCSRCRWRER